MTTSHIFDPLLDPVALPRYDLLSPEEVSVGIDTLISHAQATLERVVSVNTPATWQDSMLPLSIATERLGRAWSAVGHMGGVMDSPEWREATNSRLEAVTHFWSALAQDIRLFNKMKLLQQAADVISHPARLQALSNAIRDFRLGGAELEPHDKEEFVRTAARLAQLSQTFSENLLDSTNATVVHIEDESRLTGIPAHAREAAAAEAGRRGLEGFVFTLQQPSLMPVLQMAADRALREDLYAKHARRASELATEGPQHDNTAVMGEILLLRQRRAKLLGLSHAAQMSLASKMADSPKTVCDFLRELAKKARPNALRDLEELRDFARERLSLPDLQPWDIAFASEKLREDRYSFSEDEVRQYFPLPSVLRGLFGLVNRLFDVDIRPMIGLAPSPAWHTDVQIFEVHRGDHLVGHLFLDLYARSTKRGGAWMDDSRGRRRLGGALQTPIALLNCNFAAPTSDKPTTLTHDDVITLFHECGHGLHHLLTEVDELEVSGINGVEWDAVELPSQFMENFCWEWETLSTMTAHVDSGQPLPHALFKKMLAARNFQSGLFMLRQIEFSLFDIRIHEELTDLEPSGPVEAGAAIMRILQEVRGEVSVIQPPSFNRFAQSFSHIFAGGYAAGYYSYKWAEVLSADAYAAFEEAGIDGYGHVGHRFHAEVLSRGGSRPALDSFVAFRGRKPSMDPLLRHSDLDADSAKAA
ncbi:MAG: M3 family peptidase [Betaproteobacteria bacterium]|nr:M3 family peptidase [Betaproteobacteria bacterium]